MKRSNHALAWVLTGCLVTPAFAQNYPSNGLIGVFGDAAGTNCCITTGAGASTLHVIAITGGASSTGLTGAEFRIEVSPPQPGAFFMWTAAPAANVSLGNPIDNSSAAGDVTGANLAFSVCQRQAGMAGDHVNLGTILAFGLTGTCELRTMRHNRPSNPNFMCPLLVLCDAPVYTTAPMTLKEGDPYLLGQEPIAFRSFVNSAGCAGTTCGFVSVESSTWTSLKGLFR